MQVLREGKLDVAFQEYQQMAATCDYFAAQAQLGNICLMREELPEAIDCYRQTVAREPRHYQACGTRTDASANANANAGTGTGTGAGTHSDASTDSDADTKSDAGTDSNADAGTDCGHPDRQQWQRYPLRRYRNLYCQWR
ncbi:MAG: MSCRAMM family adhesin SdrC [Oscillatoria princeps RMCB-10]|nr:MSCRAMM family adhesin SdrC [Oscillatoria princeps RMCB-10]